MRLIYVMGTAGSGKTLLTHHLSSYMKNKLKLNVSIVNLDPGVKKNNLPYSPDVDVRDYVDYELIAIQKQLGPNGALIEAVDQLTTHIEEIRDEIEYLDSEYVILDLPGQIELFAYRSYGRALFEVLEPETQTTLFLMDPMLCLSPLSYVSVSLLGVSLSYRFPMPSLNVLTKADILKKEQIETIMKWNSDPEYLITDIESIKDKSKRLFGNEIFKIIDSLSANAMVPLALEFDAEPSDSNPLLMQLYANIQNLHGTEDEITGFSGKEDEEDRHSGSM
ncbi:MAG: ATP/GTP-binding protein [Candidatus Ranarchaeia archaeon]